MKMYEFRLKMSQKFILKGPINNIPAMIKIMAWHHPGDKPLSEPMMVSLPVHICVTGPQWIDNIVVGTTVLRVATSSETTIFTM